MVASRSKMGRRLLHLAIAASALAVSGCFLFPKKLEYRSHLMSALPQQEFQAEQGLYQLGGDGTVSYVLEGIRIDVRPTSDEELNCRFSEQSSQGEHSTNPYTYGRWVDPSMGYVPSRFTVFEISVYNYTFAKVELDPVGPVLLTDRGEILHAYGISTLSPHGSFERYYRSRRGQSGNEYYRFDLRMGLLRSTYYGRNEPVFKGENYGGLIAFDPLHAEVKKVRLVLTDFVTKFDSFDRPLETVDVPFDLNREAQMVEVAEQEEADERATTQLVVEGPREVVGNVSGDATRSANAIDAVVRSHVGSLNRCFSQRFDTGEAIPGSVVISFTVAPSGKVTRAEVIESTVENEDVGECMLRYIKTFRFRAAGAELPPPIEAVGQEGPDGYSDVDGTDSTDGGRKAASRESVRAEPLLRQQDVTVIYPFAFRALRDRDTSP